MLSILFAVLLIAYVDAELARLERQMANRSAQALASLRRIGHERPEVN